MAQSWSLLVVEDNEAVADLLNYVLTSEGSTVTIARDPQWMRKALASGAYDAVVLDVRLPGPENGISLARLAADHGCAVVLITGDHALESALIESGFRYLLKPFPIDQLHRAVEHAILDTVQSARRGANE